MYITLTPAQPPVTLLGGFLGAGKTSTLTHLLNNRAGLRVAVIVNDVASVNIDGATVRAQIQTDRKDGTQPIELLELENGCVCCGPQAGALATSIEKLVGLGVERAQPFDHIVVEMSGVADPYVVRSNLGAAGVDVARTVTLVDTPTFAELWMSYETMVDRTDASRAKAALAAPIDLEYDTCAADRRVVSLLLAQIESANLILLNKVDLASTDELNTAEATTTALTSVALGGGILGDGQRTEDAKILRTTFGVAPLNVLLPTMSNAATEIGKETAMGSGAKRDHRSSDKQRAISLARSLAADSADGSAESNSSGCGQKKPRRMDTTIDGLGIDSFVFTATDRPMDDQRLMALIQRWPVNMKATAALDLAGLRPGGTGATLAEASPWEAVLRSKGTLWLRSKYNSRCQWMFAGRMFALSETGETWESSQSTVTGRYRGDWGERKTEIVVIGLDLDEAALRAELEACLLNDQELAAYESSVHALYERQAHRNESLRFSVGEMVECNLGAKGGGWTRGQVAAHDYREVDWEDGKVMPYQIRLWPEGADGSGPYDGKFICTRAIPLDPN